MHAPLFGRLIPKKLKFFAWQVLHGKMHTQNPPQRFFSFGLQPTRMVCSLQELWGGRLNHLMWDCSFIASLWSCFFRTFEVVMARNKEYYAIFDEMLLSSPFHNKGKNFVAVMFSTFCGIWLERNNLFLEGLRGQARSFGILLSLIHLYRHPLIKFSVITNWGSFLIGIFFFVMYCSRFFCWWVVFCMHSFCTFFPNSSWKFYFL